MSDVILKSCVLVGLALGVFLATAGSTPAAPGGIPGPPNGGEEAGNNLSFPAVSQSLVSVAPRWNMPAEPVLGVHFSYGCDAPEMSGQFSYPNTSCVDSLALPSVYMDAAACTAAGAPCEGLPVDPIWWQKVEENDWWAESDKSMGAVQERTAAYLDWGDALEAVSWNERSGIRVETQPYNSLLVDSSGVFDVFDPTLETCADAAARLGLIDACRLGYQMWHVSGQGITEHWGVRADYTLGEPYTYQSPFRIIHTTAARLNLAKLVPETATCPEPGGNANDPPPEGPFSWALGANGQGSWEGTCEVEDLPYSVELSVGGKYVYGYNWRMKNVDLDQLCDGDWSKTGYYRLTFYTEGSSSPVLFDPGNPVLGAGAPPGVPAQPSIPLPVVLAEEEEETDALYTPVIDYDNNLTYLDICIVPKSQGGGGGKRD